MAELTAAAITAGSHSLSGMKLALVNEQYSKAAKSVANLIFGLGLGEVVLENGYRAVIHNTRPAKLKGSGSSGTGKYKPLHLHCQNETLRLWVGEPPHQTSVQFGLENGRLVFQTSVVSDGTAEWRLSGQENTITNYWWQAGYGCTRYSRVQVLESA